MRHSQLVCAINSVTQNVGFNSVAGTKKFYTQYAIVTETLWFRGDTLCEVKEIIARLGTDLSTGYRSLIFISDLPFAPSRRPPKRNEADVSIDGNTVLTVRCQVEEIERFESDAGQ